MAASLLAALFFLIQFKKDGKRAAPTPKSFFKMIDSSDDNGEAESVPEPIMNVKELVETFVKGQAKMFPALVVLTLAWATGSIMTDVGAKRLFERWILDGNFNPGSLPTLSFVMGMLIAGELISVCAHYLSQDVLFTNENKNFCVQNHPQVVLERPGVRWPFYFLF